MIKILILENRDEDIELIEDQMRRSGISFVSASCSKRDDYFNKIHSFKPDIILSDIALPEYDGFEALKETKLKYPSIPVIIVSGVIGEEKAAECIRLGASCFVSKNNLEGIQVGIERARKDADMLRKSDEAQKAAKHNQRFQEAIITYSFDGIIVLDEFEKIKFQSQATSRLTGYSKSSLNMIRLFDHIHQDDKQEFDLTFQRVKRMPGSTAMCKARFPHKTTGWRVIEFVIQNLMEVDFVNGYVINFRDISETEQAFNKVRDARNNYSDLFMNSSDLLFVLDNNHKIIERNNIVIHIFESGNKEVVGQSILDFSDAACDRDKFQSALERLAVTGKEQELGWWFVSGKKSKFPVDLLLSPVVFFDNPCILVKARDISDRYFSREALEQSEQKYRTLFDRNVAGVFRCSSSGIVLDCNMSFASGFDKDPIGSNINELLTIIDSKSNITTLVKKAKIIEELEAEYIHPKGDRISFLINLSFVENTGGKRSSEIVGTAINITKRKQAELLTLHQKERLEKHIVDQTSHELELEKITQDLLRYNNELEHFAYITSHNLRAPVVNMVMLQNLYNSSQPEDPENTEIMEKMRTSILKLNETISDLTDVVALKKDPRGSKSVFSVYTAVKDILKSIETQVIKAGGSVKFQFDKSLKINVDRSHFTNIVLNLLTNAIRYKHPDRDVVIQISASRSDGFLVLGINDNGLGLDLAKTGGKLFDLYQRFHPEIEGKGLGLYLVKSQIEGLGGMITVESEINIGSTFRIYFPD